MKFVGIDLRVNPRGADFSASPDVSQKMYRPAQIASLPYTIDAQIWPRLSCDGDVADPFYECFSLFSSVESIPKYIDLINLIALALYVDPVKCKFEWVQAMEGLTVAVPDNLTFLGFDIANETEQSLLYSYYREKEELDEIVHLFEPGLTEYGLFNTENDCSKFTEFSEKKFINEGPFSIFKLFAVNLK